MPRLGIALACFVSLTGGATAASDPEGAIRAFRDWVAACDNTRVCRAQAVAHTDDPGEAFAILMERGTEPDAPLRIAFRLHYAADAPADGTVRLVTDRGPIAALRIGRDLIESERGLEVAAPATRNTVLAALRRGSDVTVTVDPAPETGGHRFVVSLEGLSAALLWMENRQQRIGTSTAIVRPGTRPARTLPVAPPLPPAPRGVPFVGGAPAGLPPPVAAEIETFRPEGCAEGIQDLTGMQEPRIWRIDVSTLLVAHLCWHGSANQGETFFLVEQGERPAVRRAVFPRPYAGALDRDPDDQTPEFVLFSPAVEPTTGEVSHMSGSGREGFCGETGSWAWDGRGFQPIQLQVKAPCSPAASPLEVYRTRER